MNLFKATIDQKVSRRWLYIGLVVAAVSVALIGFYVYKQSSTETATTTTPVIRRTINANVSATGAIKPMVGAEVKVGSRISGRVEKLLVSVGSQVEKGQVIVEIDARELTGNLMKAQADIQLAEARLDSYLTGARKEERAIAVATVQQATQNMEVSTANYKRYLTLYDAGAISKSQIELAEKEWIAAKSQQEISNQQSQVAQNKYLPADINMADAQVMQARASLLNSQTQLSYATIRSPISGTVASVTTQEGETVSASNQAPTFVTIVNLSQLQVDVYIDETDVGKIKVGQKAGIVVDAYPAKDFEGEVTAISPRATLVNNVVYYIATVKLENLEGLLKPDMTANVSILLEQRPNVLAVPNLAIKKENGKAYVQVLVEGKVLARTVKLGLKDQRFTEVIEGIGEGEQVVLGGGTSTPAETTDKATKLPNMK